MWLVFPGVYVLEHLSLSLLGPPILCHSRIFTSPCTLTLVLTKALFFLNHAQPCGVKQDLWPPLLIPSKVSVSERSVTHSYEFPKSL